MKIPFSERQRIRDAKTRKNNIRYARRIQRKCSRWNSRKTNARLQNVFTSKKEIWSGKRLRFVRGYYQYRDYSEKTLSLKIDEELGLEKSPEYFLDIAQQLIDSSAGKIIFDLSACPRVWPSGITLLCSMEHWCNLTKPPRTKRPIIGSTIPKSAPVHNYLIHSGFYNYVKAPPMPDPGTYASDKIVRIVREVATEQFEARQEEIRTLVKKYSTFTADELEWFDCVVLSEILINLTEHGINVQDEGWYSLCQYHENTGIISICLADNGIGIKNSLATGPQSGSILRAMPYTRKNDSDYIKASLKTDVSGAFEAEEKQGLIPKHKRGARRGNGLDRLKRTCKNLGIEWSLVSNYGYLRIDKKGNIKHEETFNRRIFAGTFYHLIIPAKKRAENYDTN